MSDGDTEQEPSRGLSEEHREYLVKHAVDPALAEHLGVYTAYESDDLPENLRKTKQFPAIVLPWTSYDGRVWPQVRPDKPGKDTSGKVVKYRFPKSETPLLWDVTPDNTDADTLLVVEGSKQCLAAASAVLEDVRVFGMAGCRMWSKEGVPIPDLSQVSGKIVIVALDADAESNRDVYDAGLALKDACEAEGAEEVAFLRLPAGKKAGLDDVLAQRDPSARTDYLARLVRGAKAKPADRRPAAKKKRTGPEADGEAEVFPPPSDPMAVARTIEPTFTHEETLTLRRWRDTWMEWFGPHWEEVENADIRSRLWVRTEHAAYDDDGQMLKWSPNQQRISNLTEAVAAITFLPSRIEQPSWLVEMEDGLGTIVACRNGLLDVSTRDLYEHDPNYFNTVSVPFDHDPDAGEPTEWLRFLSQQWENHPDQITALQEWFGYVLSGRTDQQKILGIFGPRRSGKGTIANVLEHLVGSRNTTDPSMMDLAGDFGLQDFIGKTLAVFPDSNVGHAKDRDLIVERLLSISGGDTLSINRKYKEAWTGKLQVRMMVCANQPPALPNNSGALASRFLSLRTTVSFEDREDRTLFEEKLRPELPAILLWALEGLDRLERQGKFTKPASSEEEADTIRSMGSPMSVFIEERCMIGPAYQVAVDDVWWEWQRWCSENGRRPGTKSTMSRDVKSVVHNLSTKQKRVDGKVRRVFDGVRLREDGEEEDEGTPVGPEGVTPDHAVTPQNHSQTGSENNTSDQDHEKKEETTGTNNRELGVTAQHGVTVDPWDTYVPPAPQGSPVVFDVETADADELYRYGEGFVRLSAYDSEDGVTQPSTDHTELVQALSSASLVIGHNEIGFDLQALHKYHGLDMFKLIREGRVFDTLIAARYDDPPMARDKGVDNQRRHDLDSIGKRLELGAKTGDLRAMAKQHGGYDQIPTDDPDYRRYLVGDVELGCQVYDHYSHLVENEYVQREHKVAGLGARMSMNGFRVDVDLLTERMERVNERRAKALRYLAKHHGLVLENEKGVSYKAPLATKAGKAQIAAELKRLGAYVWRTAKADDPELSVEAMRYTAMDFHHDERIMRLCKAVAIVVGSRSVYQTVYDNLVGDRVHPKISMAQATGRWSSTKPGMTVMGKHNGRHVEREIFLPEPGHVIMAFDLAQVDMRAVAGLSQDPAYIDMLSTSDPHTDIALALFGDAGKRQTAKAIGHGWNYGEGLKKIAEDNDIPRRLVNQFDENMRRRFPRLVEWQDEVRDRAAAGELLDNGWGRKMRPDPHRAHTQGPALSGQGGARDVMMHGMLQLPEEVHPMLRAQVHDEIVLSVPSDQVDDVRQTVLDSFTFEWNNVPIIAEAAPVGDSWGHVYAQEK